MKITSNNFSNLTVAIYIASVLSEKEIYDVRRISQKIYGKTCKAKHRGKNRKRNTKGRKKALEIPYTRAKKFKLIMNLAKDIKRNGNLIITDQEDLGFASIVVESFLSDMMGRKFTV